MSRVLKVAILTVSDTCAKNSLEDKTGPRLVELFQTQTKRTWNVAATRICADELQEIQEIVKRWVDDDKIDVVVTSGGTGFAIRDITPEAIKPLLDKEAPGLIHAMFRESFNITPFAAMARLVAGIRKKSIIITVPGSVKGAVENLEAVIKLLPHASDLASDAESSRSMHAKGPEHVAKMAGVSYHAHSDDNSQVEPGHQNCPHMVSRHTSNDPSLSVTKRARESPYPMKSVEEALSLILKNTPASLVSSIPLHDPSNEHPLTDYYAAEDIYAKEEVPAYRASIVDGYAVVANDGPATYPVVSVSHASSHSMPALQSGQIARITTGAPIPPGADSVIMVEDTKLISSTEDGSEEKEVQIMATAVVGDNIREPGSDLKKGTLIVSRGERISMTGGEVGIIASSGHATLKVYTKPIVGVLSTGDELVDPADDRPLRPGEIRDSNRVSLLSTLKAHHFPVIDLGIARDTGSSLEQVLRSSIERCNVIITTGGVSMGELDLLKPTIERSLGGTIHFGRVAMKPGKPTTFATVPKRPAAATATAAGTMTDGVHTDQVMIFALPGNPASALVTFNLFVLPALKKLSGCPTTSLTDASSRIKVVLTHDIKLDARPEFHRVTIQVSETATLMATSTGMQRSSRVGSLRCTALLCLPPRTENMRIQKAGAVCDAIMVDHL